VAPPVLAGKLRSMCAQTILITGAAGFIGSHAAEAFLARGFRVVGADNFCDFYDPAWKHANVRCVGQHMEMHTVDITDASATAALVRSARPDVILHLAAMAGVRPSIEKPALYARVNVEGTVNLLQAAVGSGVSRFVFASSSSVYGNQPKVPFAEDDPVVEPISPYAATKRAGELICYTYWHLYRLPVFCLRFFTVYGPRQRPDLAIQKFTRLIDQGKPVPMFGDGTTSRDYTFIDDIVAGIVAAVERCDRYRIYNLGGSEPITLNRLISTIEETLGKKALIQRLPPQPGDVERTYADLARSTVELGYRPATSLAEGLKRFVAWYRQWKDVYV